MSIETKVTFSGSLFTKDASKVIQSAIVDEGLSKLSARVERPGRKPGRRNNPISSSRQGLILEMRSPLNWPRQSGNSWKRFVYSLVNGSFWKNQIRSVTKRIVTELN